MAGFWFGHEITINLFRELDELTDIALKKPRSLPNPKGFHYIVLVKSRHRKVNTTCLARGPSNVLTATKRPPWEVAACMR